MDTAAPVDRMVDCFNRHDPEALATCYAPDAGSIPPAGRSGRHRDLAGRRSRHLHHLSRPSAPPRNLAADDRVALLEARMTGTNTGPFPLSETERLLLGT